MILVNNFQPSYIIQYTSFLFLSKYKLTVEIPAGKKLPTLKGKGEYIKGTGRFEGIKGTLSLNGYYVTPYGKETKGDLVVNVTGTYTLPSK